MSKKKFITGSTTMTLKDFHGGSIPSELLLPSAPGISTKPPERPSAWNSTLIPTGTSAGTRAEPHRPRPGSSGGIPRALDERGPAFLSSSSSIGRHFDEDERKPFEAPSAPRRPSMASSEATHSPTITTTAQTSALSDTKRPVSSPVVAHHLSPSPGVSTSSTGNAWAARKEAPVKGGVGAELPQAQISVALSGLAAASRFSQASAIEKISSGRWQSKPPDIEVIRFQEAELFDRKPGERGPIGNEEEGKDGRAFSFSGVNERKFGGLPSDGWQKDRVTSPEVKEINVFGSHSDSSQPLSHVGSLSSTSYQQTLDEASERPKLKLLPRTKPLDPSDAKILECKQAYLYPASLKHIEETQKMYGVVGKMKPGSVGADAVNRPAERPKLNLKPRSQPIEQQDEISERERKTLFGGARPREFVLKERDIEGTDNHDITAQAHRAKSDVSRTEPKPEPAASAFNHDSLDSSQKNSRKNENWRNNPRETEKKPVEVERQPEPATWRRPVEPPKPASPPAARTVKPSSPLELAQAFSRSMSDSGVDNNHYAKQRMLPGRTQMPFSRLTDTREIYSGPTHRHINGY